MRRLAWLLLLAAAARGADPLLATKQVEHLLRHDADCLAVATSNGPSSAFEWTELARKYLFGPTERDWFCAYLVTAGLARFLYVEYETLKGEGTGKGQTKLWEAYNATHSLGMVLTQPNIMGTLTGEALVWCYRGVRILERALEMLRELLGHYEWSGEERAQIEKEVVVVGDLLAMFRESLSDRAEPSDVASYVDLPPHTGEPPEQVSCERWVDATEAGALYALYGDRQVADDMLSTVCEQCDARACALRDLSRRRDELFRAWLGANNGPAPWEPRGDDIFAAAARYEVDEGPSIGMFLLRSSRARRPYVDETPVLALALRAASRSNATLANSMRLHVMVHEGPVADLMEKWRAWVGALIGGVHLCRVGAVPPHPHNLNYLRKIFSALAISRRRAYSTIISLDDDILLAPDAILALLEHAPAAVAGPAARCAMVSPTISNGIPTAELFAADFFDDATTRSLQDCYAGTLRRKPVEGDALYNKGYEPRPLLYDVLGAPWDVHDWDPDFWWAQLWAAAPHLLWENVTSIGLGIHPVRTNVTCQRLAFEAALRLVPRQFSTRDARNARLEAAPPGAYPYLANSVWATTPDKLAASLLRVDLHLYGHPFDEAGMSTVWLHERRARLCVVRNAFVLHPQYGRTLKEDSGRGDAEAQMHAVAFGALSLREALGDDAALDLDGRDAKSAQCVDGGAASQGSTRLSRFRGRWK